jgi:hypothetical protein
MGYNLFEEVEHLLTIGQAICAAEVPVLEQHIENLRTWINDAGVPLVEVPPISSGSKFFACLTHDVDFAGIRNHKFDRTMAGFLSRAIVGSVSSYRRGDFSGEMVRRNWLAVLRLPQVLLRLSRDPWNTFQEYIAIEGGARSTFFFVAFKGRPGRLVDGVAPVARAVKYDLLELQSVVEGILRAGCEIGVHGIDGWLDSRLGREELDRVREVSGQAKLGIRMHWLYSDKETAVQLEKAGYEFDSSAGYNDAIGFRAGTSQVYSPVGAEHLLELPMHIMDTALFYPNRMGLMLSQGMQKIHRLIDGQVRYGGVLTLNWHDRSLAPERLWGEVYCRALERLRGSGARFMTAGAVVDWFRRRRSISLRRVEFGTSRVSVRVDGLMVNKADGFVLRLHRAPTGEHFGEKKSGGPPYGRLFRDFPITGKGDIVALGGS